MNSEQYQRVEQLFETLRTAPLDQAERRLDELCPDDEEVRREVLSLLRNAAPTGIEAPTADLVAGVQAVAEDYAAGVADLGGEQIGRYRLIAPLGRGGMGAVYLAEQSEPIRRQVALKVIKLGMDTEEVVARFEAERQALAVMEHPGIARVYDAGATPAGRPFFAMELVRGAPLTEYCDDHRLDVPARLAMFGQVCDAVHHAHQKGLIHRDLKPSNVLIAEVDGTPTPKIIDFGVSKAIGQSLTGATLHTQAGQIIGTPQYMSPEQVAASQDIDTRSDIYALGVMLYELMTGALPYDESTLDSGSLLALLQQIRETEPPRASTRLGGLQDADRIATQRGAAVNGLQRQLRGDIDWIIAKALEKDRTRRYSSAAELRQDIEAHLRDEPVTAGPPTTGYRMRKFYRRHPIGVPAAAAAALLVVAGLAGTTWQAVRATRAEGEARSLAVREAEAREEAESALEDARRSRARAEAAEDEAVQRAEELETVARFQAAQLSDLDPELMGVRLREDLLAEVRRAASERGAHQEEIDGEVRRLEQAIAGVNLTNIALATLQENILDNALSAVDEQFPEQPLVRARLLHTLAATMTQLGLWKQAEAPLDEALRIRRDRLGAEDDAALASLGLRGTLRQRLGRLDEARADLEAVVSARAASLGENHPDTLDAQARLASVAQEQGEIEDAATLCREAFAGLEQALGESDERTLAALVSLTDALRVLGEFEEAETLAKELVRRREERHGRRHRETAMALTLLASVLQGAGRHEESIPYFEEVVEIRQQVLGDAHERTRAAINNLSSTLTTVGRYAEAERYQRRLLETRRTVLGDQHPNTLTSLNNLAMTLRAQDRHEEAEPLMREAVQTHRALLGDASPQTMQYITNFAALLSSIGKHEEAAALGEEAIRLARTHLPEGHWSVGMHLLQHGMTLTAMGRYSEAAAFLSESRERLVAGLGEEHPFAKRPATALAALYEKWHEAEPGAGHDAEAERWRLLASTDVLSGT